MPARLQQRLAKPHMLDRIRVRRPGEVLDQGDGRAMAADLGEPIMAGISRGAGRDDPRRRGPHLLGGANQLGCGAITSTTSRGQLVDLRRESIRRSGFAQRLTQHRDVLFDV